METLKKVEKYVQRSVAFEQVKASRVCEKFTLTLIMKSGRTFHESNIRKLSHCENEKFSNKNELKHVIPTDVS